MARTRSHPAAAAWLHFGGAVAQLGERLVRNEEVRGSTPLGSTTRNSQYCRPANAGTRKHHLWNMDPATGAPRALARTTAYEAVIDHPLETCSSGVAGFPSQWLRNAASQARPAGS
jgi:hypothetical protein